MQTCPNSFETAEKMEKAKKMKIKSVVLDRNGYPYHGRVKAFVESVRKNGLNL